MKTFEEFTGLVYDGDFEVGKLNQPHNLVITGPDGSELLRAEETGEVWVRGEKVADNKDFYVKFCERIGVDP